MKKLLLLTLSLVLGLTVLAQPVSAGTQDFTIESFDANYFVDRRDDGVPVMKVDELIQARFPEFDQNHGILRAIPTKYKGQPLGVSIQSVKDEKGNTLKYTTYKENDNLVLKIGDANTYVHGVIYYHLTYDVKNMISFFGDHDEFFWDVNGTQWAQPFAKVTATVHVPAYLSTSLLPRLTCYTGVQGSTDQNCSIGQQKSGYETQIKIATIQSLSPGGNLSFIMEFKPGTFKKDLAAQRQKMIYLATLAGLVVVPPLLALVVVYNKWRKAGRDARGRGTIVPQYVPPKGFNSLTSDIILQEKLRQKAVTALVIELAIRKYISIGETADANGKNPDYTVTLLKPTDGLNTEERAVIQMFFNDYKPGTTVGLLGLKKTMSGDFSRLANNAPDALSKAGYFTSNPAKAGSGLRTLGASILLALLFFGIFLIQVSYYLSALMIGAALAAFVLIIASRYMPARTTVGVEVLEYLQGLKMYMQLAEADRLKYLQSPAGVRQWGDPSQPQTKLKLFEKLLPYAIIFGIEKDWAKEFEDIYDQPPDWYTGNWSSFNTGYLIGSLNSFSAASGVAFTPPQSSSSSGFSGGGSSGGGGGGGGGGGW